MHCAVRRSSREAEQAKLTRRAYSTCTRQGRGMWSVRDNVEGLHRTCFFAPWTLSYPAWRTHQPLLEGPMQAQAGDRVRERNEADLLTSCTVASQGLAPAVSDSLPLACVTGPGHAGCTPWPSELPLGPELPRPKCRGMHQPPRFYW